MIKLQETEWFGVPPKQQKCFTNSSKPKHAFRCERVRCTIRFGSSRSTILRFVVVLSRVHGTERKFEYIHGPRTTAEVIPAPRHCSSSPSDRVLPPWRLCTFLGGPAHAQYGWSAGEIAKDAAVGRIGPAPRRLAIYRRLWCHMAFTLLARCTEPLRGDG